MVRVEVVDVGLVAHDCDEPTGQILVLFIRIFRQRPGAHIRENQLIRADGVDLVSTFPGPIR